MCQLSCPGRFSGFGGNFCASVSSKSFGGTVDTDNPENL